MKRWRPPPEHWPDRRHARNVADLVHQARLDAEAADRQFYETLLNESEQKGDTSEED